jgi:hypothetical protein
MQIIWFWAEVVFTNHFVRPIQCNLQIALAGLAVSLALTNQGGNTSFDTSLASFINHVDLWERIPSVSTKTGGGECLLCL